VAREVGDWSEQAVRAAAARTAMVGRERNVMLSLDLEQEGAKRFTSPCAGRRIRSVRQGGEFVSGERV
jgi:hypothetical protein